MPGIVRELRTGMRAVAGRGTDFTHQPPGRHVDPAGIAGYYCDFRHKALAAAEHADRFPRSSSRGGRAEWAIPVAQCALGYWELRLEDHPAGDGFLPLSDWLVEQAEEASGGIVWRTPFAQEKYGLSPGWPSAMAQGEAISVLVRAHRATGEERYLDAARRAFVPMTVPVSRGGVLRDGRPILEEYPSEQLCAVLNGWAFALFGLHELSLATGEAAPRTLLEESCAALIELLPQYDIGWWSLYSLYDHGRPDLAKPFYQRLHPVLLDALASIRPNPELTRYARRFEAQLGAVGIARASADKLVFRLRRRT